MNQKNVSALIEATQSGLGVVLTALRNFFSP